MDLNITDYMRLVGTLTLVVGLIFGLGLVLRRYGEWAGMTVRQRGPRRLALQEVLVLDTRRRLVLIRQDGVEHLLLLAPTGDLVVQRGSPLPPAGAGGSPGFQQVLSDAVNRTAP